MAFDQHMNQDSGRRANPPTIGHDRGLDLPETYNPAEDDTVGGQLRFDSTGTRKNEPNRILELLNTSRKNVSTLLRKNPDHETAHAQGKGEAGSHSAGGREEVDDKYLTKQTFFEFDSMVGDLKKHFTRWNQSSEGELISEQHFMTEQKRKLVEEKEKVYKSIETEKKLEKERLQNDRRKIEYEISMQYSQIDIEKEDARRRTQQDKERFEDEVIQHKSRMAFVRGRFHREYEDYQGVKQSVLDINISTETTIELNVGGVVYETSRHTLMQQPGSYLEAVVTGRYSAERDRNGRIFFDRDSEIFESILRFLRDPQQSPAPRELADSEALATEAEFYGIKFFPFPLVYACGGHTGTEHLRSVELLDISQQCWRMCQSFETERAYFGSANLNNRLFLFGGQNLDYKALSNCEMYDCLINSWTSISSGLNIPRRNLSSAVCDGRIYAIGGFDGTSIISAVEAYDSRTKNWMEVCPMTTPRSSAAACERAGKIYVLGGSRGERLSSVEMYDPRNNKWQTLNTKMIEVRSAATALTIGSLIYCVGGTDNAHTTHSSAEVFDSENLTWSLLNAMNEPRMDHATANLADSLMVSGGQSGGVLSSTEFFRPELNEWQPGPSMMCPRYGHSLLVAAI